MRNNIAYIKEQYAAKANQYLIANYGWNVYALAAELDVTPEECSCALEAESQTVYAPIMEFSGAEDLGGSDTTTWENPAYTSVTGAASAPTDVWQGGISQSNISPTSHANPNADFMGMPSHPW